MKTCPLCKTELCETRLHSEMVDRCPSCDGIFFEKGELESIVKIVHIYLNVTLDEPEIDTITEQEKLRKLPCPCEGSLMETKDIGGQFVDMCPKCEGIWLDAGEICALVVAENHIKQNFNLYIRLGK